MKLLIYLGHPAHFHLFRNVVDALRSRGHETLFVIKKKDILEDLLRRAGYPYENIQEGGRGEGTARIAIGLLSRDLRMLGIARRFRPSLMLGTSVEITHVGRLLGIPSMIVNEDDADVVPIFARLGYPFADHILAPSSCRVGKWTHKTVTYPGYQELSYLHPAHFSPDESVGRALRGNADRYFILRFAKLTAYHDVGRTGIHTAIAEGLIRLLEPKGRVYISAERELERQFEPYRIEIDPLRMHDALYFADLYVGDSQTMAAEAAVLGTPSLRFNDFVGQIGYLEDLEHRYGLTMGIPTGSPDRLLEKCGEILGDPASKSTWSARRARMLGENVDLAAFMSWLIEGYPDSVPAVRGDPGIYDRFMVAPAATA